MKNFKELVIGGMAVFLVPVFWWLIEFNPAMNYLDSQFLLLKDNMRFWIGIFVWLVLEYGYVCAIVHISHIKLSNMWILKTISINAFLGVLVMLMIKNTEVKMYILTFLVLHIVIYSCMMLFKRTILHVKQ